MVRDVGWGICFCLSQHRPAKQTLQETAQRRLSDIAYYAAECHSVNPDRSVFGIVEKRVACAV